MFIIKTMVMRKRGIFNSDFVSLGKISHFRKTGNYQFYGFRAQNHMLTIKYEHVQIL